MSANHFFWDNRRRAANVLRYRPVGPVSKINRLVIQGIRWRDPHADAERVQKAQKAGPAAIG